jgi:hypothetical protein
LKSSERGKGKAVKTKSPARFDKDFTSRTLTNQDYFCTLPVLDTTT